MMEKEKYKHILKKINVKNLMAFLIVFVAGIVIFMPWIKFHMSGDDYTITNIGYLGFMKKYSLNDGRIFTALIIFIFDRLKIDIIMAQRICLILGIFVNSISVVYLKSIIQKIKIHNNKLINIEKSSKDTEKKPYTKNKKINDVEKRLTKTTINNNDELKRLAKTNTNNDDAVKRLTKITTNKNDAEEKLIKINRSKEIIEEIIALIISFVTIYNFFEIDVLYFLESCVINLSILLSIICANKIVNKDKLWKITLIEITAMFCYQATSILVIAFTFIFLMLYKDKSKKEICNNMLLVFICFIISVIAQYLFIKIYNVNTNYSPTRVPRLSKMETYARQLEIVLPQMFADTFGYFTKYAFLLILIVNSLMFLLKARKENLEDVVLLRYLLIVLILVLLNVGFKIITLSSYNSGRTNIPLGMVIGSTFICFYMVSKKIDIYDILEMILLLFTLIIIIVNFEKIINEYNKTIIDDKIKIEKMKSNIEEYENKTGKKINNITEVIIGYNPNNLCMITTPTLENKTSSFAMIKYYTNIECEEHFTKYDKIDNYENINKEMQNNGYAILENTVFIPIYYY